MGVVLINTNLQDNANSSQINKVIVHEMVVTSPDNIPTGKVSLQYLDQELPEDRYITNLVFNTDFSKYLNEFKEVAGSNNFIVKITNLTKETTLLGTVTNIANTEVKITIATDDEKSFTTQEIEVDDELIVELDFASEDVTPLAINGLKIQDENGISLGTVDENLRLKNIGFDNTTKTLEGSTIVKQTVFVDTVNGNDVTGELESENKPFSSFHTAMAALPTNGSYWTVVLMNETINVTRRFAINTNVKIFSYLSNGSILNFDNVLENDGITPAQYVMLNNRSCVFEFENVGLTCTTTENRYFSPATTGNSYSFKFLGTLNYFKWSSGANGGINQGKFPLGVDGTDLTIKELVVEQANATNECVFVSRNNRPKVKLTIETLDIRSSFTGLTHYPDNYEFTINNIVQNNLGVTYNWSFFGIGGTPSKIVLDGSVNINGTAVVRCTTLELNILISNSTSKLNCNSSGNITGYVNTNYALLFIKEFGGIKTFRNLTAWVDCNLDDYGISIKNGAKLVLDNSYIKINKTLAHRGITGSETILPAQDNIEIRGITNIEQINSGELFRDRRYTSRPIAPINVIIKGEVYFNGINWGSYVTLRKESWSSTDKKSELKITHKYQLINKTLDTSITYLIDGTITLSAGEFIKIPDTGNLTINGYGLESSKITKAVAGESIFKKSATNSAGLQLQGLKLDGGGVGTCFDLEDSTGNNALEFNVVNLENFASLGILNGYRQFLGTTLGIYGCGSGFMLDGTWSGFKITNTNVFGFGSSGKLFEAGPTLLFNSRFYAELNTSLPTGAILSDFSIGNFNSNKLFQLKNGQYTLNGSNDAVVNTPILLPNISEKEDVAFFEGNQGISNSFEPFSRIKGEDGLFYEIYVDATGTLTARTV